MLGEGKMADKKIKRFPADEIRQSILTVDGSGIRYHTFSDIGKYTVFPAQMRKRLFPSKAFGTIDQDECNEIGNIGIMCREQGLRITSDLARLTLPSERKVDYQAIAHEMQSSE